MDIKELQKSWDSFGQKDPFWAILTSSSRRNNKWSQKEFFATGETQIALVMNQLDSMGLHLQRGRCLDFGCGVGRLTQALCQFFEQCDGVDIAPSMVKAARHYNGYAERCRYHLNEMSDLRLFADNSFDFIYSTLVLQHMQPEYSKSYIGEFVRVLKPGGVVLFQIPSEFNRLLHTYSLPDSGFRAAISFDTPALTIAPGSEKTILVKVQNVSDVAWPAAGASDIAYQIMLGNHWLDAQGNIVLYDDGRSGLPKHLDPHQEVDIPLTITAPKEPGSYTLELDLVQELVAWFKNKGSQTLKIPVQNKFNRIVDTYRALSQLFVKKQLAAEDLPVMEMHTVHRDEVVEVIQQHGGKIIDIQEDQYCGSGWISYSYFATK